MQFAFVFPKMGVLWPIKSSVVEKEGLERIPYVCT